MSNFLQNNRYHAHNSCFYSLFMTTYVNAVRMAAIMGHLQVPCPKTQRNNPHPPYTRHTNLRVTSFVFKGRLDLELRFCQVYCTDQPTFEYLSTYELMACPVIEWLTESSSSSGHPQKFCRIVPRPKPEVASK